MLTVGCSRQLPCEWQLEWNETTCTTCNRPITSHMQDICIRSFESAHARKGTRNISCFTIARIYLCEWLSGDHNSVKTYCIWIILGCIKQYLVVLSKYITNRCIFWHASDHDAVKSAKHLHKWNRRIRKLVDDRRLTGNTRRCPYMAVKQLADRR